MNSDLISPDCWKNDLQNRGYTVEETPNGMTLIVVKLNGDEVARKKASGREAIWMLRESIIGGESVAPYLTAVQRDSFNFQIGQPVVNKDTDLPERLCDSGWV